MTQPEFTNYQPNPEVLQDLGRIELVAVIGVTAVGKSSILDLVKERNPDVVHLSPSTISRPLRHGEQDGVDFHSRSEEEMRRRIAGGEYVQVAPHTLGAIYATAPEDYPPNGVAAMPVIAKAMPAFLSLPFKNVRQLYTLPPSLEAWQERIGQRQYTQNELQKRMKEAKDSLEYAVKAPNLVFIINDVLGQAADEFEQTILEGREALVTVDSGRQLAQELLKSL